MKMMRFMIAVLPAVLLASQVQAQDVSTLIQKRGVFGVGGSIGWYLPSNSRIQSAFGKSVFKYGLDLGPAPQVANGKLGPSISFVSAQKGSNKLMALSGMAAFEAPIGWKRGDSAEPYYKIGVGIAYQDFSFNDAGVHYAGKQLVPTAEFRVGVIWQKNFELFAAYDLYASSHGFNPSGLNIGISYTVIRF